MSILNNSKIIIAKDIAIDRDYINVLNYTETQMLELLNSNNHYVNSANDFSFIRQNDNNIFVDFTYNECLQSNYIAFQNPDYSNKWFFAWIDDVIYNSDNSVELVYTIDSWSTWFSNWQAKTCFVAREHVNDDTIGINTIPENLDVGEVIEESKEEINLTYETDLITREYYFIIMTTFNPAEGSQGDFVGVNRVNKNLFGSKLYAFGDTSTEINYLRNFIIDTNNKSKIESIQAIFTVPAQLIRNISTTERTGYIGPGQTGEYKFLEINESKEAYLLPYNFEVINNYSDFQPKNNKCYVYPYNYMLISNNVGNQNIYKYENFILNGSINPNPIVELELALSIGCSGRLVPKGYKNIDKNYDESLPLGKYPTCAWASDSFTNWLTSNSLNIATSVGLGLLGATIGLATGGVGLVAGGLSVAGSISNVIGQFRKADLLPSIEGGNNSGDINFSTVANNFVLHHMRVKTEYLKCIDDYFTRFGYKINRVKVPNITGRRYWNYVEIGSSEDIGTGSVPTKYMEIINNACRKGVTIWHNHDNIGNFNLNNEII